MMMTRFTTAMRAAVELPRNGVRNARPHRLRVSVAGLGCGGFSRLGLGIGKSEAEAVAPVRQALDRSVNPPDTSAVYGTDGVVGRPGLDPPFSMPGISARYSSRQLLRRFLRMAKSLDAIKDYVMLRAPAEPAPGLN